jgi:hypothetical protein
MLTKLLNHDALAAKRLPSWLRVWSACVLPKAMIAVFGVLITSGCQKVIDAGEKLRQERAGERAVVIRAAGAVIADPNNWKQQAAALVKFDEAVANERWKHKESVKAFRANALSLMEFAATWTAEVSSEQFERVKDENFKLLGMGQVNAGKNISVDGSKVGATSSVDAKLQVDSATRGKVMENTLQLTASKLDSDKAKRFRELFEAALLAFSGICNEQI